MFFVSHAQCQELRNVQLGGKRSACQCFFFLLSCPITVQQGQDKFHTNQLPYHVLIQLHVCLGRLVKTMLKLIYTFPSPFLYQMMSLDSHNIYILINKLCVRSNMILADIPYYSNQSSSDEQNAVICTCSRHFQPCKNASVDKALKKLNSSL